MELKNQVCSLEISKKLKELGVKQESLFYWSSYAMKFKKETHELLPEDEINPSFMEDYTSAFTVAELGEMLPETVNMVGNYYGLIIEKYTGSWNVRYEWTASDKTDRDFFWEADTKQADSLGKMLVYLLENNLLSNHK